MNKLTLIKRISALKHAITALEEEIGFADDPTPPKRRNSFREQLEENELSGTWKKPKELKAQKNRSANSGRFNNQ